MNQGVSQYGKKMYKNGSSIFMRTSAQNPFTSEAKAQ